ncbi:hypothetical protein EV426DRAFT_625534 [Tirmania nivea]|nr:hypothetical protein EV426DRAFT_625534 [Tirmania nivea]
MCCVRLVSIRFCLYISSVFCFFTCDRPVDFFRCWLSCLDLSLVVLRFTFSLSVSVASIISASPVLCWLLVFPTFLFMSIYQ